MENNYLDILNNFFDHIYILTIERAAERHKKIKEDLNGLQFSFFYGTDKNNISEKDLILNNIYNPEKAKELNRYNKAMKLGEIACSMGHKAIYEDTLKNNFQKVLILEDDVIINNDGINVLSSILNQLPQNYCIPVLEY